MKSKLLFVPLVLALLAPPLHGEGTSTLEILEEIAIDAKPIDVAVSADGYWIYVLTADARVQVYSAQGQLKGWAPVATGAREITCGPEDEVIFVSNDERQTVQIVRISLVHDFPIAHSPVKGPANAPVTLTLFTDFECTYCARLAPVLDQVQQQYPERVKIVFKNYPLRMHPFARQAAIAALAANEQGQFWPFHDRLFQNYNRLNAQKVEAIRKELDLDPEKFQASMNDPALQEQILDDLQQGTAAGVRGTPSVYVNGRKMPYRLSLEGFRKAIDEALDGSTTKP